ncbi:MAG: acetyl-CoA carboxylase biotin carboxyl carrier protein subunit [Chloroflexi bacterium]|nr:acetyl-CoA carboxylase biotin carboxyl carrier protein subunit [Chloroflexota bacterium]
MKSQFNSTDIDLTSTGKGYQVVIGDKTLSVEILHSENGRLDLLLDGQRVTAFVSFDGVKRWVTIGGQTFALTKSTAGTRRAQHGHHAQDELTAPMPGQVRAVNVAEGESVTKGQTLLVLEAMKMEIRVSAPKDGRVGKLLIQQGQTVEREQVLIEIVDKLES